MQPEKYMGKTGATQGAAPRVALWATIAIILLAGLGLYFAYDRSLTPVLGTSSASPAAPAR